MSIFAKSATPEPATDRVAPSPHDPRWNRIINGSPQPGACALSDFWVVRDGISPYLVTNNGYTVAWGNGVRWLSEAVANTPIPFSQYKPRGECWIWDSGIQVWKRFGFCHASSDTHWHSDFTHWLPGAEAHKPTVTPAETERPNWAVQVLQSEVVELRRQLASVQSDRDQLKNDAYSAVAKSVQRAKACMLKDERIARLEKELEAAKSTVLVEYSYEAKQAIGDIRSLFRGDPDARAHGSVVDEVVRVRNERRQYKSSAQYLQESLTRAAKSGAGLLEQVDLLKAHIKLFESQQMRWHAFWRTFKLFADCSGSYAEVLCAFRECSVGPDIPQSVSSASVSQTTSKVS